MRRIFLLLLLLLPMLGGQPSAATLWAAPGCTPEVSTRVDVLERHAGVPVALTVTVRAGTGHDDGNALTQIRLTGRTNAIAEAAGSRQPLPDLVTLTQPMPAWTFVLRRTGPSGGFQANIVASDRCGEVPKLVGFGGGGAAPGTAPTPTPTASPAPSTPTPTPTPVPGNGKLFGVALAGAEFTDSRLPGRQHFDYVYPTDRASYGYYAARGQLLIRLPFRWERVQPAAFGALSEPDLAGIVAALDSAAASGQRVILDLHNYGRYYEQPLTRADAARLADVWVRLARAVRGHPGLFGYELMNEPHDLPDGATGWNEICQAVTDAIRREDTTSWVLIPGYSWQSAHTWPEQNRALDVRDPAGRLLYAAHAYFDQDNSGTYRNGYDAASPSVGPDRLRPFTTWLEQRNARGIVTEYGVPDNDPRWIEVLSRFVGALDVEPRIMGGSYWAGGPWWGTYPLSVEPLGGQDRPQMAVLAAHPSRP